MKKPLSLAALFATLALAAPAVATTERPNIIFILTDDLGWGDLGVFFQNGRSASGNGASFLTPHIDTLAAEGVRMTHHYCAAPVCAPSRASLLTGVSQGHANVRDNQFDKALEDNHTLATVLRRAGYATAAIGKWGLHGQPNTSTDGAHPDAPAHPLNRGFDSFYGMLRHIDGHEHYPKEAPYFSEKAKARGPVSVWDNRSNVTAGLDQCYTADLFTARAKKFITDHTAVAPARPFFLYLAYDTPHAAIELPAQAYPAGGGLKGGLQWLGTPGHIINTASGTVDSWVHPDYAAAEYDHDHDPATPARAWRDIDKRYATSIRRLDDCVGDLIRLLQDLRIDDRTLVVFTSDNGASNESYLLEEFTPEFFASFGPFDGLKRDLWEGGLRIPAIARWPGHIPAGKVDAQPSAQWDWLPTFADLAGLPAPARTDGVSLLPALTGERRVRERGPLYFEYKIAGRTPDYPAFERSRRNRLRGQMQAVRLGDLMGVRYDVKSARDDFEIYNVVTDPKETKNLAGEQAHAATQQFMQAAALRLRRPNATAPRPYDTALVPALAPAATVAGIEWRAYAGPFPWVPDYEALTPIASGTASRPDPAGVVPAGAQGLCITGNLLVPADGEYTFYLTADTGAVLRLHEAAVIDADFGYAPGTEKAAVIRLQAGRHPFRLSAIHAEGRVPALQLAWSGPGLTRQPVADDALVHTAPSASVAP